MKTFILLFVLLGWTVNASGVDPVSEAKHNIRRELASQLLKRQTSLESERKIEAAVLASTDAELADIAAKLVILGQDKDLPPEPVKISTFEEAY